MSTVMQKRADSAATTADGVVHWTSDQLLVFDSQVRAGERYDLHAHGEDQLAWMARGSTEVDALGERWSLGGQHMMWLPAGVAHEMSFAETGRLLSLYVDPAHRPEGARWDEVHVLRHDPLAGALLAHLAESRPTLERRRRSWSLLRDLLGDAERDEVSVALPRDPRVRPIAAALIEDPADQRELEDWAASLGVSGKTVARAFLAETGVGFREWRMRVRMRTAAARLMRGESVSTVAEVVGYDTVSGFIAVFRARHGVTPAVFAARGASTPR